MVDALLQGIRTVYRWMDTRRFAWLMAASAGAHIVFVLLLEAHPGVDGRIYQDVTQRIIASGSLTACGALNGAYWPPLFCYLLAGFWLVVGKSPALFFIFNVTVALATALISRQFLRRMFDFRIACWS